jgi:hypothetical protein
MQLTRTVTAYRDGSVGRPNAGGDTMTALSGERATRLVAERILDEALADSFPASDPPSWSPGVIRPLQDHGRVAAFFKSGESKAARIREAGPALDTSPTSPNERGFRRVLGPLAEAAGVALLMGVAVLLIGLPIALAIRGLLEAIGWLFGIGIR